MKKKFMFLCFVYALSIIPFSVNVLADDQDQEEVTADNWLRYNLSNNDYGFDTSQFTLSTTIRDMDILNAEYQKLVDEFAAAGWGTKVQPNTTEFQGYTTDVMDLFNSVFGDINASLSIERAEVNFDTADFFNRGTTERNQAYESFLSEKLFQELQSSLSISDAMKQAQSLQSTDLKSMDELRTTLGQYTSVLEQEAADKLEQNQNGLYAGMKEGSQQYEFEKLLLSVQNESDYVEAYMILYEEDPRVFQSYNYLDLIKDVTKDQFVESGLRKYYAGISNIPTEIQDGTLDLSDIFEKRSNSSAGIPEDADIKRFESLYPKN